jgi:hypothetical protein
MKAKAAPGREARPYDLALGRGRLLRQNLYAKTIMQLRFHNQDRANKYLSTNCMVCVDNRRMFGRRPKTQTIGSVRLSGQRVVIICNACRTITYVAAADLNLSDKFQIDVLDKVMTCPSCKAYGSHISVSVEEN